MAVEFTVPFREANANEVIAVSLGHDCTKPLLESSSLMLPEAVLSGKPIVVKFHRVHGSQLLPFDLSAKLGDVSSVMTDKI